MSKTSADYSDTITLTFGDVAENHVGMQKIGKKASKGFSVKDLLVIKNRFDGVGGCVTELIDLTPDSTVYPTLSFEPAQVLIVRNGVKALLPDGMSATDLHIEQAGLNHDTKAFMKGRVVNKRARYNLCFSDKSQEPDYASGKGRIIAFDDVPLTNHMRKTLPTMLGSGAKDLQLEGNYYFDVTKCGIGFHGDTERRMVIGIRLGAVFPLHFQWFNKFNPLVKIPRTIIELSHGDFYIMSDKATGYDWKKSSFPTLRHAAGCSKFTTIVSKFKY